VKLRLYNPSALHESVHLSVRILDPSGTTIHRYETSLPPWEGIREITSADVKAPQLWSPSHPALYQCEVTLSGAHGEISNTERFGFRYFEFENKGPFRLNGQRLHLRGTQRHEDHAGLGSAMPEDLIRKEMLMIKQMGANFIRLGHYQQSRIALDLCDELGLLVWEEIPWCRSGIGSERWQQLTRATLHNMIDQHYNHPSVILWGLGNENDWPGEYPEINKDKIRSFLSELQETSHQLDPSRVTSIRRCDFCKDIPDVYSPSIWAGWYSGRYTDYRNLVDKQTQQVNHFLHIEWGGDSHARRHSEDIDRMLATFLAGNKSDDQNNLLSSGITQGSKGDWSETYICNLFDWHLKEQENMAALTGSAQWAFKDFSTPLRPENPVPRVNQKGVTERDLTPKEGYYVFQSYWAEEPMAHIYGHTWPIRWGDPEEKKLVKVYSNCEKAQLFLNGKSQGAKIRNSQDFPAAGLHWLVTFKPGENRIEVKAAKNGKQVSDELVLDYQTTRWGPPARLELREKSRREDQVTLEAVMVDASGTRCLDARHQVRFDMSGDGALIGNLGTNTASHQVELYNGRAEITLLCRSGKSVVSISTKGLPTSFATVR
jgi:beta-galactosidase